MKTRKRSTKLTILKMGISRKLKEMKQNFDSSMDALVTEVHRKE